jgi:hypothetical protein
MRSSRSGTTAGATYALILLAGVALASCAPLGSPPSPIAHPAGAPARPAEARWLRSELYFAVARVDDARDAVDEQAWIAFLDEEVTPRFPDGFSVFDAYGQWRGKADVARLRSKVLVVLHPDTEEAKARIEAVRVAFLSRTGQQSVLRASWPAAVSF